eukprot:15130600-Alexandrium_andersonii.AAC.1
MAALGLRTGPREIIVVTAYAPQSARPLDEGSSFYEQLGDFLDSLETKGAIMIAGYFKARLTRLTHEDVLGPHHLITQAAHM